MALSVSCLDKSLHDRKAFDCGDAALNDFLRTKAARHQDQRVSRTFVLADESAPERVLGFYTLSNGQIARQELRPGEARTLPRHPITAVMLARLAVDRDHQGRNFGLWLLMDAVKRCALVGRQSGVYALVVDAKHAKAQAFYTRHGFIPIEGKPLSLYLPMETAIKALIAAQP